MDDLKDRMRARGLRQNAVDLRAMADVLDSVATGIEHGIGNARMARVLVDNMLADVRAFLKGGAA